jgi:glycosyltransferase involved in cell wall biosynthesis
VLWARATENLVDRLVGESRDDIILDAHFLYPDAVAAIILGRRLGIPVVMSARGSDVNVKCENPVMRRWVCWAANQCAAVITVSRALAERLASFGIAQDRLHTLPNGVDLEKFRPRPDSSRRPPGADTVLLSAGHLVEAKGHHLAVEALIKLPKTSLLIVGEGPNESSLRALANKLGVSSRVHFLGYVAHEQMAEVYSAADFTVLASANEGMPNVMLESLACGTRVIATEVGGVGEVMTAPEAGAMMKSRCAASVVESVFTLRKAEHSRDETRKFAERFGWDDTVQRQLALYEQVISQ